MSEGSELEKAAEEYAELWSERLPRRAGFCRGALWLLERAREKATTVRRGSDEHQEVVPLSALESLCGEGGK